MRYALGVVLLFVLGSAQAALVEFDFNSEPITQAVTNGVTWSESGFDFFARTTDAGQCCETQARWSSTSIDFIYPEILDETEDPYPLLSLERSDGGSFDLVGAHMTALQSFRGDIYPLYTIVLTGHLQGGGTVQLRNIYTISGTLGSEWQGLSKLDVSFSAQTGSDFALLSVNKITVSTVPIPPAVWLFGSALAGLGWIRRQHSS